MKITERSTVHSVSTAFKHHMKAEHGISLDFRVMKHVKNENYSEMRLIVESLYKFAEDARSNSENFYPHFSGWNWSLKQTLEELRDIMTLKDLVNRVAHDLVYLRAELRRYECGNVYKYCKMQRAYVFEGKSH